MDYGLPSGLELFQMVVRNLTPSSFNERLSFLESCKIQSPHVEAFWDALRNSGCSSVDMFLEHRSDFREAGKLAMAFEIAKLENNNQLFNIDKKGNSWYEYLFKKLFAPFDEIGNNQISVITFNYDRSLEHFLFTSVKNTFGRTDSVCAKLINKIPIIHVHGKLGSLPWQEGKAFRAYDSSKLDYDNIRKASEEIIIVSEGQDASSEFDRARQELSKALKIYFLGFGYNDTNLNRLKINELNIMRAPGKAMIGTSMGLGGIEKVQIASKWKIRFDHDYPILKFLREDAHID